MNDQDLRTIARIAHEAQTASDNASGTSPNKAFLLLDEGSQGEAIERVKRCLESSDASVFGKVARSVALALTDHGVLGDSFRVNTPDGELPAYLAEGANIQAEVERNTPVLVDRTVLEAGAGPDDLLTAGTPEEGLESFTGEADSAQPNHKRDDLDEAVEFVGEPFDNDEPPTVSGKKKSKRHE